VCLDVCGGWVVLSVVDVCGGGVWLSVVDMCVVTVCG
jgi:hypothetical protein